MEAIGMPLRIDLGPFEKLFIGKSVLTNNGDRTMFILDGTSPMMRARDILSADQAINPVEKLYRCLQQMYLEEDTRKYRPSYMAFLAQAVAEYPDHHDDLTRADECVLRGRFYEGLKALKRLINPEAFQSNQVEAAGSSRRTARWVASGR
jgi:flagellar protein FlbT